MVLAAMLWVLREGVLNLAAIVGCLMMLMLTIPGVLLLTKPSVKEDEH